MRIYIVDVECITRVPGPCAPEVKQLTVRATNAAELQSAVIKELETVDRSLMRIVHVVHWEEIT